MIVTAGQEFPPKGTEPSVHMKQAWARDLGFIKLASFNTVDPDTRAELRSVLLSALDTMRERQYLLNPDIAILASLVLDIIQELTP